MKCLKCGSIMVSEEFKDYQQTGAYTFTGWRCLSCGLILDPVIMDHHLAQRKNEAKPDLISDLIKEELAEVG